MTCLTPPTSRICVTRGKTLAISHVTAGLLAAVVCLGANVSDARAGADGVITFDGVFVRSTEPDTMSDARGLGATMRVLGTREPFNLQVGGFAAIGRPDSARRMRDIYDIHVNFGLEPVTKKRRLMVPFASLGVDFLYVTTREPRGSAAGMTMGMNARGGVFGYLSEDWIYSASVTYIGAVVPGTGEGLDGVIVQFGLGKRLFD